MEPKPKGWSAEYAAAFQEDSVVDRYHLRPPLPAETFEVLAALAVDEPRTVLDAGCGPGDLARQLASRVERVDAVDRSASMIAKGRALPGGDAPNLRWIHAAIEEAPLEPPYALIVAGDSIHWFDWEAALPRLAAALSPRGVLALVGREWLREQHVRDTLRPVYARHGWNRDFIALDPVDELERRGLFERLGEHRTAPGPWRPTPDELIGCYHSQSGFVLEKMADPKAFDREVTEAVDEVVPKRDGRYELDVVAEIVWGRPQG